MPMFLAPEVFRNFNTYVPARIFGLVLVLLLLMIFFCVSVKHVELFNYYLSMLLFSAVANHVSMPPAVASSILSNWVLKRNNTATSVESSKNLLFSSSNRDKSAGAVVVWHKKCIPPIVMQMCSLTII